MAVRQQATETAAPPSLKPLATSLRSHLRFARTRSRCARSHRRCPRLPRLSTQGCFPAIPREVNPSPSVNNRSQNTLLQQMVDGPLLRFPALRLVSAMGQNSTK
jgi:hypothetical protein